MYSILKIQSSNPTSKLWLRIIYRIFNALQNVNLIICHKRVPRITKWHTAHTLTLTRTQRLTEAMHRDRNVYAMRRHLAICVNSISFYSLTNIFRQLSVCVRRHFVLPLGPWNVSAYFVRVCVCVRASSLCISNSRKFPKANPEKLLQVKIKCDRIRVKVRAVCKCFLISYPPFPHQLLSCLWFQASTATNILFSLHLLLLLLLLHLVWLNWCQWFVRVFLTLFGRLTRPCNYSRGRQPHQQREA